MQPVTKSRLLAFRRLCELEPRLERLYDDVAAVVDDGTAPFFDPNDYWYGYGSTRGEGFRRRMIYLVGSERERDPGAPEELKTSAAYDLAYDVLFDLLPPPRYRK
jgi:hypothetical protein